MTYKQREAIFSKEALDRNDIMALYDVCVNEASKIMMQIKLVTGDRLKVKGKLHIQDYFDYFGIKENRYGPRKDDEKKAEDLHEECKSPKGESVNETIPLIRSSSILGG